MSSDYFKKYNFGNSKIGVYGKNNPYGAGLSYDINEKYTVYGGALYQGGSPKKLSSYGGEVGLNCSGCTLL